MLKVCDFTAFFFSQELEAGQTLTLGRCFSTCITTGWMDGIFTRGKLFSSSSSSLEYLFNPRVNRVCFCLNSESIATHLSASLPSAMTATRSIRFSRSSSKTDWWNSRRGVPWRSRKGSADWRVGSRMPFSICSHQVSINCCCFHSHFNI